MYFSKLRKSISDQFDTKTQTQNPFIPAGIRCNKYNCFCIILLMPNCIASGTTTFSILISFCIIINKSNSNLFKLIIDHTLNCLLTPKMFNTICQWNIFKNDWFTIIYIHDSMLFWKNSFWRNSSWNWFLLWI